MYKLIALYPHPTDKAHFRRYYEESHMPLARTLPGLRRHRYAFEPETLGQPSPYFCVFEGEWDSKRDFEAALASEIGQKTAADVGNYATGGCTLLHFEAA